ncbi:Cytoplasmic protein [Pseudomonas donghuensis]
MNCPLAFMQIACMLAPIHPKNTLAMNPEALVLLVTREMPYGKYQGRLIADLPGHYLNWFARQGFPKGELGGLLALMHEVDHNGLSDLLVPLRKKHPRPRN